MVENVNVFSYSNNTNSNSYIPSLGIKDSSFFIAILCNIGMCLQYCVRKCYISINYRNKFLGRRCSQQLAEYAMYIYMLLANDYSEPTKVVSLTNTSMILSITMCLHSQFVDVGTMPKRTKLQNPKMVET